MADVFRHASRIDGFFSKKSKKTKKNEKKGLHFSKSRDILSNVPSEQVNTTRGISTVGRTKFSDVRPTLKAVNGESAQNSSGIFGALAQLVERTNSNASPLLILYQKAVNVKSAQNLTGIFGAIAQLVARYIRIVEVRGSNPLSSTKSKEVEPIKWFGFFLWHGYCAPCFTTGKFIEEAAAVVDDRLAALLEKS